ncbi:MAG: NAD(P)/FAD-dependent oxidoreductase [Burkholderiales bacterium]
MSASPFDLLVIGEGVAGLTAARAAAREGLAVATFEANIFGGLVLNVNELDPVPPGAGASGTDYASTLMSECSEAGVVSHSEPVECLNAANGAVTLTTAGGMHTSRAVIVASGASLKRLGVPGEMEYAYKGVSQCADCDGPLFQGAEVVVVGGGDSALQEALVLAHYADRVHVLMRGAAPRAKPEWLARVKAEPKIAFHPQTTVQRIEGGQMVERVVVRGADGAERPLACAGVFAYIGLEPNTAFLPPAVTRDGSGRIVTDDKMATSLPRVFAAGAVRVGDDGTLAGAARDGDAAAANAVATIRD